MEDPEPVGPRELEGQDAPWVLERTCLAIRASGALDSLLDVDLVKAECGRGRTGEGRVGVFAKLAYGGKVGQRVRLV